MEDADLVEMRGSELRRVTLHGPEDFEGMRKAGRLAAATLDHVTPFVKPGVTTAELDRICHEFTLEHGAIPAPLNYAPPGHTPFPKATCTSVNHVVCHGIPGDKKLRDGDILNIDVTVILDGWHGDTSRMFIAGKAGVQARKLVDTTYDAMMLGIQQVKPGNTTGDIGHAIQVFAEGQRFSVVEVFCGHGIGKVFHTAPTILHYGNPGEGMELKPGMFFTVEPMVNVGVPDVHVLSDGWTAVTRDKKLSAQFEHTVGVTETGVEIFTESPKGWSKPPYM